MAARTLDRVPYLIIPVDTSWQELEIPSGFLRNQPGDVTLEVQSGTFYFAVGESAPSNTTYSPPFSDSGTVRLIVTVGKKLWFKPASTDDRAFLSQ